MARRRKNFFKLISIGTIDYSIEQSLFRQLQQIFSKNTAPCRLSAEAGAPQPGK
jgi:hypothetical protein